MCPKHGFKPSSVSIRRHRKRILRFHQYVSIEIDRRIHLLHKKFHITAVISEKIMFFKKDPRLHIVFFAGHNIKRNPHTCLMFYLHQIFNQLFKNIECFRHSDIKHAFCLVKSQPGTLPSRQKNCTDFSFPECFQSRFPIQIFLLSDFGKFGRLQRRKCSSLLFFLMNQGSQLFHIFPGYDCFIVGVIMVGKFPVFFRIYKSYFQVLPF